MTFAPRHRVLLRALAEAMFSHAASPSSQRLTAFVDDVDDFLSPVSAFLRFGLLRTLELLAILPLFLLGKLALFNGLSVDDRVRMLTRMERSAFWPITLIFIGWKTMLTMLFFEHPDELRALGYPGDAPASLRRCHTRTLGSGT
ncbi:MAG: hypothetical protein WCI05_00815 [Myxococcales bacterium]